MPIIFELTGRPISKKRNYVMSRGRMFLGQAYRKWEKLASEQLRYTPKAGIGKLKISYTFYIKGKYKVDLDNLVVGINDVLQSAKIIENDDAIVNINAQKVVEQEDWKTFVKIESF